MFYNDIFIKSLKINLLQVAFYHNSNHHQLINLISPHKFGLIGYPLGHSFSKNFFNQKFQSENIDAEYVNF